MVQPGVHGPGWRYLDHTETIQRVFSTRRQLWADIDSLGRTVPELGEMCRELVLMDVLRFAIAWSHADMGNIQVFDPASRTLSIVVQRGFQRPFLDFFARVHTGAACGTALQRRERVVVRDVTQSDVFLRTPALEVILEAGVRAVQSTPIIDNAGRVLGVLSTHYRRERDFRPTDFQWLDAAAASLPALIAPASASA